MPTYDPTQFGFSTRAIHAGQEPDPLTGAVTVPLYQTSTYASITCSISTSLLGEMIVPSVFTSGQDEI